MKQLLCAGGLFLVLWHTLTKAIVNRAIPEIPHIADSLPWTSTIVTVLCTLTIYSNVAYVKRVLTRMPGQGPVKGLTPIIVFLIMGFVSNTTMTSINLRKVAFELDFQSPPSKSSGQDTGMCQ